MIIEHEAIDHELDSDATSIVFGGDGARGVRRVCEMCCSQDIHLVEGGLEVLYNDGLLFAVVVVMHLEIKAGYLLMLRRVKRVVHLLLVVFDVSDRYQLQFELLDESQLEVVATSQLDVVSYLRIVRGHLHSLEERT